jgi:hypothetical protein
MPPRNPRNPCLHGKGKHDRGQTARPLMCEHGLVESIGYEDDAREVCAASHVPVSVDAHRQLWLGEIAQGDKF